MGCQILVDLLGKIEFFTIRLRSDKFNGNENENENETENKTGEATYRGALRAPSAGSPACVFVFVFVLIYVYLQKNRVDMRWLEKTNWNSACSYGM